jgi:hypothetical protein
MENHNFKSENEAWLCPTVIYPKENEYLKVAFIDFKTRPEKPIYYFTLHTKEENHSPTDIEK